MRRLTQSPALRTLGILVPLIAAWQGVAAYVDIAYILPRPTAVLEAGYKAIESGTLLADLRISLFRALVGFGVAALFAIPTGMAAGWWKPVNDTLGSLIELLRPIPGLALMPLTIVWFGFSETSKIMLIAYACFFSIYLNTHAGVRNVDPLFIKVMKVYGNGQRDILTKVVLYSMLPYTFTGLRYAVAISLIFLVAVELVGAQNGLAFSLAVAQQFLRTGEIYFTIIVFGVIGFIFNALVSYIERKVIRWRQYVGAEM